MTKADEEETEPEPKKWDLPSVTEHDNFVKKVARAHALSFNPNPKKLRTADRMYGENESD